MVECNASDLVVRVRFSHPAPKKLKKGNIQMKKNKYLIIVFLILMLILILNLASPIVGVEATTLLTTITTITGIFSVFVEMKRSADIAECEFIFSLQKQFEDNEIIQEVFKNLDNVYSDGEKIEIERRKMVSYLTFFEMMCSLIIKGVLKIEDIDALYAYPFFIAMNNKEIQDTELIKFRQFYRNIFTVYPKWFKYRKFHEFEIPYENNKLV